MKGSHTFNVNHGTEGITRAEGVDGARAGSGGGTGHGRRSAASAPEALATDQARLTKLEGPYAVTGSLAASRRAEVAPAALAAVYVRNIDKAASRLALRIAPSGGNVVLLEPLAECRRPDEVAVIQIGALAP
jgi:hypothetical protein